MGGGWTNNDITTLVLPTGATTGARIVIGPELPPPLDTYLLFGVYPASQGIIFYSPTPSNDDYIFLVQFITPFQHYVMFGAVLNGAVVESKPGHPQGMQWTLGGNGTFFSQALSEFDIVQGDGASFRAVDFLGTGNTPFVGASQVDTFVPGTATVETWHALPPTGGWSNFGAPYPPLRYERVASPPRSIWVQGLITGGATATGTIIGQLPAGYQPQFAQRDTAYAFGGTMNIVTETPAIEFKTNGDITLLGDVNAAFLFVNSIVSLD